jgi:hypothetical protein
MSFHLSLFDTLLRNSIIKNYDVMLCTFLNRVIYLLIFKYHVICFNCLPLLCQYLTLSLLSVDFVSVFNIFIAICRFWSSWSVKLGDTNPLKRIYRGFKQWWGSADVWVNLRIMLHFGNNVRFMFEVDSIVISPKTPFGGHSELHPSPSHICAVSIVSPWIFSLSY